DGGVLQADEGTAGSGEGDNGGGAQAGASGVQPAEVRGGVRGEIHGGVRARAPRAAGARAAPQGPRSGLRARRAGGADPESDDRMTARWSWKLVGSDHPRRRAEVGDSDRK